MGKMIFIPIALILIISCKAIKPEKKRQSFEGIIKYSVITEIKIKDKFSDYIRKKYGKQMDFYWKKNGDQLRKTLGNNIGLEYAIYKQKENIYFNKFRNIDTLFYYSGSEIFDEIIEIKEGPEEIIINQKCKSLIFKIKSFNQKDTSSMHYYYSGKPFIDKDLYTNLKDGFANIVYEKTEAPFLKMKLDFNKFSITYTAIEVIEKNLENLEFEISEKIPKKKY